MPVKFLRNLGRQAADVASFALDTLAPIDQAAANRNLAAHAAFARPDEAASDQPTDVGTPPVDVGGRFKGIASHPELVELQAHLTEIHAGHAIEWQNLTSDVCVCGCGWRFVGRDEHAAHVAEIQTNAVVFAYEAAAFTASAAARQ